MDNVAYFNKLYKILENKDIQCAFYHYCLDFASKNEYAELSELKKIDTNAKAEIIIKHLHPFYVYLKNKYLLKHKPIDVFLKDLTIDYNNTSSSNNSVIEVSRFMKEVGIAGKSSTGNRLRFKISYEELFAMYTKNKWIHEIEVDNSEHEDKVKEEDTFVGPHAKTAIVSDNKALIEENKKLRDRLEMLEKKYNITKEEDVNDDDFDTPDIERMPTKSLFRKPVSVYKKITTKTDEQPPTKKTMTVKRAKVYVEDEETINKKIEKFTLLLN